MLLSTSTGNLSGKLGLEGTLKSLKEAGFDAFDLSISNLTRGENAPLMQEDYPEFLKALKQTADALGLVCNLAHGAFVPEKYGDEAYNRDSFARTVREMEAAAFLGAPIIVIHPVKDLPKGVDPVTENLRFYRSLIPYCEKYGIKVAVENIFEYDALRKRQKPCGIGTSRQLAAFVDLLGCDWFTICLDVGHAAINGEEPQDAVRILGKRIGCVHIHDNDFVNDSHTVPYLGRFNWDAICKAFAEIGYEGDFTSEASAYETFFPRELIPAALRLEASVFRYLMARIDSYR